MDLRGSAAKSSPILAAVVDGGQFYPLGLGEVQMLLFGISRLALELSRSNGGVPADVRVLESLLGRVVASAQVADRLPTAAVLGSPGSVGWGLAGTVEDMEIREVAEALECGQRNVRDLIARGALSARKRGGRWLVDQLSVVELLESRRSA